MWHHIKFDSCSIIMSNLTCAIHTWVSSDPLTGNCVLWQTSKLKPLILSRWECWRQHLFVWQILRCGTDPVKYSAFSSSEHVQKFMKMDLTSLYLNLLLIFVLVLNLQSQMQIVSALNKVPQCSSLHHQLENNRTKWANHCEELCIIQGCKPCFDFPGFSMYYSAIVLFV